MFEMETERIHVSHWIATLRRKDTSTLHRIPVDGVDLVEAAISAKMQAEQRFSDAIKVEVLE
jgi:hypothetical protein